MIQSVKHRGATESFCMNLNYDAKIIKKQKKDIQKRLIFYKNRTKPPFPPQVWSKKGVNKSLDSHNYGSFETGMCHFSTCIDKTKKGPVWDPI